MKPKAWITIKVKSNTPLAHRKTVPYYRLYDVFIVDNPARAAEFYEDLRKYCKQFAKSKWAKYEEE